LIEFLNEVWWTILVSRLLILNFLLILIDFFKLVMLMNHFVWRRIFELIILFYFWLFVDLIILRVSHKYIAFFVKKRRIKIYFNLRISSWPFKHFKIFIACLICVVCNLLFLKYQLQKKMLLHYFFTITVICFWV